VEVAREEGVRGPVAGAWRFASHVARARRAARELRRETADLSSLEEAVALAERFESDGIRIRPGQERSEILRLLEIVRVERPKVVLEIGTKFGGSLYLLARAAPSDALLVSIDIPHGYHVSLGVLYRSFAHGRQRVRLVRADSHDAATLRRVKTILRRRQVDLLHIDGDHTAEGVRADYAMYGPLVRSGGLIAFHDLVLPGVAALWEELEGEKTEIVADPNQRTCGFGLLRRT